MQPCAGQIRGFQCQDVFDALSQVAPGSIATLILCLIGFLHNVLLLKTAYGIKWFHHCQFFLIVNQSVVDLLTSFFFGLSAIRMLWYSSTQTPDIMTNGNCHLSYLPANILFTCGQNCALMVAFDRFYLVLFPFNWLQRKEYYRYGLIALAWFMAITTQTALLFSLSVDFDYNGDSYQKYGVPICTPRAAPNFVDVYVFAQVCCLICCIVSIIVSVLILIFYIIIPVFGATMCKRVADGQKHVQVFWSGMEQHQRAFLIRVRRMSFATVFIYLCTMFIGTLILDYSFMIFTHEKKYLIIPIATAVSMINTIPSLHVFAWKDDAFRQELKKLFTFGICRKNILQKSGE